MALPGFRVAQVESGGIPTVRHYKVTAAEAFVAGDVVRLMDTGSIVVAEDNDAAALGIALADADPGKMIPVAEFVGGVVFSGKNTGTAYAATDKSGAASLDVSVGGVHSVVVGTAGNALFDLVGADSTDASRVLVVVPAAKSQVPGWGTAAPDASS